MKNAYMMACRWSARYRYIYLSRYRRTPQWERIRKAMIDENSTIQDYMTGLVAKDFKARGWAWG
jgi:hypothetical protein